MVALIALAPLVSALLLLFGGKAFDKLARFLGPLSVLIAFIATLASFQRLRGLEESKRVILHHLIQWVDAGKLHIGIDFRFDPLSAVMCLVVTGVGFLIHVYATGYMHGDPRFRRFFGYLNLFVFSMLILVLGDNLLVMFAGWELVGACSYLLIGFYFDRPSAATAAKKAFITTRIGDLGLMIGIFLAYTKVGSLQISEILHHIEGGHVAAASVTAIGILLFVGAIGKSAQVPLYVWLPDAMEGPTPVSALIHAATMVTAGVYLVVRLNPIYHQSQAASAFVAVIGTITAVYAAALALKEPDIKRVLAYSTVSQLGFMFIAAGVGAYGAAIFHLVTHAFFKALLFLAAGSVMHGMHDETHLQKMGGLRKYMPWTFAVTAIGWVAITGILPFSGFFSKDEIVASALSQNRLVLFWAAVAGAALTAFYMSRLLLLAFGGKPRFDEHHVHPHESPPSMVVPMAILAVASIVGGALNFPGWLPGAEKLVHWLEPVIGHHAAPEGLAATFVLWAVAIAAFFVAVVMFGGARAVRTSARETWIGALLRNKFFVDEIYATLIVAPLRLLATALAYVVDLRLIDGVVNGVATLVGRFADVGRRVQSGNVRQYAVGVLGGAAAIVAFLAVRAGS